VTYAAKAEHESIKNYKVLQQFFGIKGVTKHVDVEKLMKGKPMDNLEFLQWLKGFYDEQCTNIPYDALARRRGLGYQPAAAATFRPAKPTSASRSNCFCRRRRCRASQVVVRAEGGYLSTGRGLLDSRPPSIAAARPLSAARQLCLSPHWPHCPRARRTARSVTACAALGSGLPASRTMASPTATMRARTPGSSAVAADRPPLRRSLGERLPPAQRGTTPAQRGATPGRPDINVSGPPARAHAPRPACGGRRTAEHAQGCAGVAEATWGRRSRGASGSARSLWSPPPWNGRRGRRRG
jgi:hypothetical protein